MTIGTELRQAREERGLTLAEISARTKIRLPILRAIERDDFRQLPGGVIGRGFLRLFAREVGLDDKQIGARYTAEFGTSGASSSPAAADSGALHGAALPDMGGTTSPRTEAAHPSHIDGDPPSQTAGSPISGLSRPRAAGLALAGVAVLAVGYLALRPSLNRPVAVAGPESSTNAAVATVGTSLASTPAGSTEPAPPSAPAPPVPAPKASADDVLRVDLQATAPCWVSASADGEQIAFRELKEGERLAVRAAKEVVVRIGIPANLTVSINDQRMPPPSRPGTPVTLRITPANYRELLKSQIAQ